MKLMLKVIAMASAGFCIALMPVSVDAQRPLPDAERTIPGRP